MTNTDAGSEPWVDPDDAPELTDAEAGDVEMFAGDRFVRRGRGRPKGETAREQISVRLDADLLARLREFGPGWQSQINPTLRRAFGLDLVVEDQGRLVRDELQQIGKEEVAVLRIYVAGDWVSQMSLDALMRFAEENKRVPIIEEVTLSVPSKEDVTIK